MSNSDEKMNCSAYSGSNCRVMNDFNDEEIERIVNTYGLDHWKVQLAVDAIKYHCPVTSGQNEPTVYTCGSWICDVLNQYVTEHVHGDCSILKF